MYKFSYNDLKKKFPKNEGQIEIYRKTIENLNNGLTPDNAFSEAAEDENFYGDRPDIVVERNAVSEQLKKDLGLSFKYNNQ